MSGRGEGGGALGLQTYLSPPPSSAGPKGVVAGRQLQQSLPASSPYLRKVGATDNHTPERGTDCLTLEKNCSPLLICQYLQSRERLDFVIRKISVISLG